MAVEDGGGRASRWPDLSAEEIRRGLEIGIELVKARLQEAERLVAVIGDPSSEHPSRLLKNPLALRLAS